MNSWMKHPISALELYRCQANYRIFDYKMRLHAWLALILLSLWGPLGLGLDESWGWENSLIENSQLVIIALGAWTSLRISRRFESKTRLKRFWLWSMAVWGMCFARELSWGRSLFPQNLPGEPPIFYSMDELGIGCWFHPVIGLAIIVIAIGLLWNLDLKGMIRTTRIPVLCLVIFLFSAVLSSMIDQKFFSMALARAKVLEEFGETVMWWSLLGVISSNTGHRS